MQKTLFSDLKLIAPLQKALQEAGYDTPTPIQAQAIPYLLEGRDLLGVAQTGTGKTAAFALPILNQLMLSGPKAKPRVPRVLVLTPTRELAIQVEESFRTYGKHLRLKYTVIFGGVGQVPQVRAMSAGVDVLVATPGRLLDLIEQRYISLSSLEVFVLDEADRMLDMGFFNDIKKIIKLLPSKRHNLFFSATMPPDIQALANTILVDPVRVEVTPPATTVELIEQKLMFVEKDKKKDVLLTILQDQSYKRVIVFTRTKHGANKVVIHLEKHGVSSDAIHGNKSQSARQRALNDFRLGKTRVLIATDIAARGIDIDDITHVINYELPNVPESYVHRIGRTARAGAKGKALAFCDREERVFLRDIERITKIKIEVIPAPEIVHVPQVAGYRAKPEREEGGNRGPAQRSGRRPTTFKKKAPTGFRRS